MARNESHPGEVPEDILNYKLEDWVIDAIGAILELTYQGGDAMDAEFRAQFEEDFAALMDH